MITSIGHGSTLLKLHLPKLDRLKTFLTPSAPPLPVVPTRETRAILLPKGPTDIHLLPLPHRQAPSRRTSLHLVFVSLYSPPQSLLLMDMTLASALSPLLENPGIRSTLLANAPPLNSVPQAKALVLILHMLTLHPLSPRATLPHRLDAIGWSTPSLLPFAPVPI